ncbi:MAG: hypothetical protein U0V70_03830 [Terriglobia bacterium]
MSSTGLRASATRWKIHAESFDPEGVELNGTHTFNPFGVGGVNLILTVGFALRCCAHPRLLAFVPCGDMQPGKQGMREKRSVSDLFMEVSQMECQQAGIAESGSREDTPTLPHSKRDALVPFKRFAARARVSNLRRHGTTLSKIVSLLAGCRTPRMSSIVPQSPPKMVG